MDINYAKVRKVILNDRWKRIYKPDRAVIDRLGRTLPDCNIFGFAYDKTLGYWCLMVESYFFPDNPYGVIRDMNIADTYSYSPPPPKPTTPTDPTKPIAFPKIGKWFW